MVVTREYKSFCLFLFACYLVSFFFFVYKDKLREVEDRVDAYDDYIEAEYRQDRLSFEEYRKLERQQEKLEDRLDTAEDKLERDFKINA